MSELTDKIKVSAGLLITRNREILLTHPTGFPRHEGFSIPKGRLSPGESPLACAIRETQEEIGLTIPRSLIKPDVHKIETKSWTGVPKTIHVFRVELPETFKLPRFKLQWSEVDFAGFLDLKSARIVIDERQLELLKLV